MPVCEISTGAQAPWRTGIASGIHGWTLWFDAASVPFGSDSSVQKNRIRKVVETTRLDHLNLAFKQVSSTLLSSLYGGNVRFFRSGVPPLATSGPNKNGGSWTLRMTDWEETVAVWNLVVSLLLKPSNVITGPLHGLCGVVLSRSSTGFATLSLWLGGESLSVEHVIAAGRALAALAASAWVRVPSDWAYVTHNSAIKSCMLGHDSATSLTLASYSKSHVSPTVGPSDSSSICVTITELKRRARSIDGDLPEMDDLPAEQLLSVRYASQLLDATCAVKVDAMTNASVSVDIDVLKKGSKISHSPESYSKMFGIKARALYYAIPGAAVVCLLGYVSFSAWTM